MTIPTSISCSNFEAVQSVLWEGRVHELYHCLQKCFNGYWRNQISQQSTPEVAEDVLWNAIEALDRKSRREKINLTASLCTFFGSFIPFFWKKNRDKKAKSPEVNPLDDGIEFFADPYENALIGIYQKEATEAMQQCIAELNDREQTVVRAYVEGTKDEEIMHEIGYSKRTGVAVFRKRTFKKLKGLLEAKGLTPSLFQIEQP